MKPSLIDITLGDHTYSIRVGPQDRDCFYELISLGAFSCPFCRVCYSSDKVGYAILTIQTWVDSGIDLLSATRTMYLAGASRTDFEGFLPCPSPDSAFAR